jgi:hypothetical protein
MAKAASMAARQTSRKAGVRSTAKKMDSTRHGFSTEPPARKIAGAFGAEGRGSRRQAGTQTSKRGAAAALGSMKTTARTAKRKERAD